MSGPAGGRPAAVPGEAPSRPLLPGEFYARPTLEVAGDLLGCVLVRERDGLLQAGRIVETEGYLGPGDLASHAGRGPTPRSRIMWGPPGTAYVYLIYGMHHCLNVVTEPAGTAGAVLIRAIEPLTGISAGTAGPARLCRALGITRELNGWDLSVGERLYLTAGEPLPAERVATSARIGVPGQEPWRFYLRGNPFLSRPG